MTCSHTHKNIHTHTHAHSPTHALTCKHTNIHAHLNQHSGENTVIFFINYKDITLNYVAFVTTVGHFANSKGSA